MNTEHGTDENGSGERGERVLHVRFERSDGERIEDVFGALDEGGRPEPYFEVVFHDPDQLHLVTRPKNLELLRAITREEPKSIRETARLVDRDVRQVHRNLRELESLGLIELEDAGRAKRPTVWYDSIEVDLPLDFPASGEREANA
ncbi:MAG: helix-turn-helix domain-containing protein [Halalkalicoccus sp.]